MMFATIVTSCSSKSSMSDYIQTVRSAKTTLPIAVEIERLFPGETDHFITQYGMNDVTGEQSNQWNTEAHFYGRYSLTMQIEVKVDYDKCTIRPAGKPVFYLTEYTGIDDLHDGRFAATSKPEGGATFNDEKWHKICEKGGDFSVVGVVVQKDSPLPNFQKYVQLIRAPRVAISLIDN